MILSRIVLLYSTTRASTSDQTSVGQSSADSQASQTTNPVVSKDLVNTFRTQNLSEGEKTAKLREKQYVEHILQLTWLSFNKIDELTNHLPTDLRIVEKKLERLDTFQNKIDEITAF